MAPRILGKNKDYTLSEAGGPVHILHIPVLTLRRAVPPKPNQLQPSGLTPGGALLTAIAGDLYLRLSGGEKPFKAVLAAGMASVWVPSEAFGIQLSVLIDEWFDEQIKAASS